MSAVGLVNDGGLDADIVNSTITKAELASAEFVTMITLDSDNDVDLRAFELDKAVVVDGIETPAAVYGGVSAESGAYTVSATTADIAGVKLGASDTTLNITGLDSATVKTESGSATYSVNSETFTAAASALEIDVAGNKVTLGEGTVTVTEANPLATTGNATEVEVTGDSNGVVVEVTSGVVVSIVDLDASGVVNFDGKTYTMLNGDVLKVTDGSDVTLLGGMKVTDNILGEGSAIEYFQIVDGVLNLGEGTAVAADNVEVLYGTVAKADFANEYNFTLDGDSATGYTLTGAYDSDLTIDATAVEGLNLTAAFDANVLTGASDTAKVNGAEFTSAGEQLNILADSSTAKLFAGTVALDADDNVTVADDYAVKATAGNGVNVTAESGTLTAISSLNAGEGADTFEVTDASGTTLSYTMAAAGLVRESSALWTGAGENVTLADLLKAENWQAIVAADSGVLTINSSIDSDSLVVDSVGDPSTIYGTVYVDSTDSASTVYTLSKDAADASATLTGVVVDGVKATIAPDFALVPTTANSATFTVNADKAFTVDATSDVAFVSGAYSVVVESGSVGLAEGTVATDGNIRFSVDAGSFVASNDGTLAISGVIASDTSFTVTEGNGIKVTTADLGGDTVTYTVGSVKFQIEGDNDSNSAIGAAGVTFTVDGNNNVTAIDGLNAGAKVRISGLDASATFTVNTASFTADEDGNISAIGIRQGTYAANLLAQYYIINVDAQQNISITLLDKDGNIVIDSDTGEATVYTDSDVTTEYASYAEGIVKLGEGKDPSEGIIVISNQSSTLGIQLQNNESGIVYVSDLKAINDGDGYEIGLQAIDNKTLKLVAIDETSGISDVTNTTLSGSLTIPDGYTLQVTNDLTVSNGGTVEFDGDTIILDGSGMAVNGTGTFEFVSSAASIAEAASYTLNNSTYAVISDATITNTTGLDVLNEGSVVVTGTLSVYDNSELKQVVVYNDLDGAIVEVTNAEVSSITFLSVGGTVEFDNDTYKMVDSDTLTVTDNSNNIKIYTITQGEATNILDLSNLEVSAYIQITDDINLADGIAKLTGVDSVIYGTSATYESDSEVATLTYDSDNEVYELNGNGGYAVNAGTATFDELNVGFEADVTTPASTDVVEINGASYASADGASLTVAADSDTSKLKAGTVALTSDSDSATASVTSFGSDVTVTATAGDGITVTASGGRLEEIGGLNTGDAFNVGGESYSVAAVGIVNGTKLWDNTAASVTPDSLNVADNWVNMVALDSEQDVDLTELTELGQGVIVDDLSSPTEIYGTVYVDSDGYDVTFTNATAKGIKLGDSDTTLNITNSAGDDAPFVVTTAAGTATYTINGDDYTAAGTALEVVFRDSYGTQLANGSVTVTDQVTTTNADTDANVVEVTGDTDGTVVVVSSGNVESITKLSTNGVVKFGDSTYMMVGDRLQITDSTGAITFYTGGEDVNILNPQGNSTAFIPLESDYSADIAKGIAALAAGAASVEYGIVDADGTTSSAATLTGADGEYTLESGTDVDEITGIDASGATDLTSLTTDFDVDVNTPATSDTVIVNGVSYASTSDSLVIAATAADSDAGTAASSALKDGEVIISSNSTTNSVVPSDADSNTVTALAGDFTVKVNGGVLQEVSGIDADEIFNIGNDTITKKGYGLLVDDSNNKTVVLNGTENATSYTPDTYDETPVLVIDSEGTLTLDGVSDTSIVVDNSLDNKVGDLTVDTNGNYRISGDPEADVLETIVLGSETAVLTTELPVMVTTTDDGDSDSYVEYTVNGVRYTAVSALTIDATSSSSTSMLSAGTVHLDSTEMNAPNSVTVGSRTITATGTEIDVTAVNGVATTISDIDGFADGDEQESFEIITNTGSGIETDTYKQTALGLIRNNNALLTGSNVENYSYNIDDTANTWTNIEILTDDDNTITLSSDTEVPVSFVNSDMTAVVATYDSDATTLTAGTEVAGAVNISNDVATTTFKDFSSDTVITTSGASFNASNGNEFTVAVTVDDSDNTVTSVTGAVGIELVSGEITVDTDTAVIAGNAVFGIVSEAATDGKYTIAVDESTGDVTVTGLDAVSSSISGANFKVSVEPISNTVTYTIGDQTYTIKSDADDKAFTFTLDSEGNVTDISGLDVDAQLTITNNSSEAYNVTINGNDGVFENGIAAGTSRTAVGTTEAGQDEWAVELDNGSYYVVFDGNAITVYNVVADENDGWNISESPISSSAFGEYNNGIITMKAGLIPSSENFVAVSNESSVAVQLKSSNDTTYMLNLTNLGVHIEDTTLHVVEVDNNVISYATIAPQTGSITVPQGLTLSVVEDSYTIVVGEGDGGTVTFSEEGATLNGENMTATVNDETYLTINATDTDSTVYTINGDVYKTDADSDVTATIITSATTDGVDSKLYGGTVVLNAEGDTVDTANNKVAFVVGEIKVTANNGDLASIDAINAGDSFTVDDVTYTMTAIGLIYSDQDGSYIWTGADIADGGSVTYDDIVAGSGNWSYMVEAESETLELATFTYTDDDAIIVDSIANPTVKYGTVAFDGDSTYTVTGSDTDVTVISLGSDSATLAISEIDSVKVITAQGSGTYTIENGGGTFTAENSDLDFTVENGNAVTLNAGVIRVANDDTAISSDVTVAPADSDDDGVVVTVSDAKVTSITDLDDGGKIEFNNVTYEMVGDVLKVTENNTTSLYSGKDSDTNILKPGDADMAYIALTGNDDTADISAGIAILSDTDSTVTSVVYGVGDDYKADDIKLTFTQGENGYVVAAIKDADTDDLTVDVSEVDSEITLTTTLDIDVITDSDTAVNVNGTRYVPGADEGLEIEASSDGTVSKLYNGTVALDSDATTVSPSDDSDVSVTGGAITVKVENGALIEIGALDFDSDAVLSTASCSWTMM